MKKILVKLGLQSTSEEEVPVPQRPAKASPTRRYLVTDFITKIQECCQAAEHIPPEDLKDIARLLSDRQELLFSYLSVEHDGTLKLLEKLDDIENKVELPTQLKNIAWVDAEHDVRSLSKEAAYPPFKVGSTLKVRVVLLESTPYETYEKNFTFRKALSPVKTKLEVAETTTTSPVTLVSAVAVGPWLLQWSQSGLCVPRRMYSDMAMYIREIELPLEVQLQKEYNTEHTLSRLADFLITWNSSKKYDAVSCNCQHFVETLVSHLEIDLFKPGAAWNLFWQTMKKNAHAQAHMTITEAVRVACSLTDTKPKNFDTHQELDEFFTLLLQGNPEFKEKFAAEACLLKNFDLLFWARHFRDQAREDCKACTLHGCPFGDPSQLNPSSTCWF